MSVTTIYHQVICALSRHTPDMTDVMKLIKGGLDPVYSECAKCHTPLQLRRKDMTSGRYYAEEFTYLTPEQYEEHLQRQKNRNQ